MKFFYSILFCLFNSNVTFANLAIEWVPRTNKEDHLYLAALHAPYSLVIWNVNKGWKEWKKSFTDILSTFSFDPFDGTKLACW